MVNIELLKHEKISVLSKKVKVKINENISEVSIVITNKRLLVFDYPNIKDLVNSDKKVDYHIANKKQIVFETKLNNIEKIIENTLFDKYILKDKSCIYIHDDLLRKYFKKQNNIIKKILHKTL